MSKSQDWLTTPLTDEERKMWVSTHMDIGDTGHSRNIHRAIWTDLVEQRRLVVTGMRVRWKDHNKSCKGNALVVVFPDGHEQKFNHVKHALETLHIFKPWQLYQAVRRNRPCKGYRFRWQKGEPQIKKQTKSFVIKNTMTGEKKEFTRYTDCATFIGVSRQAVANLCLGISKTVSQVWVLDKRELTGV